jgi:hypothetical protein
MPSLNQTTEQVPVVLERLVDKVGSHKKASSQYKVVTIDTGEWSVLRLVLKKDYSKR